VGPVSDDIHPVTGVVAEAVGSFAGSRARFPGCIGASGLPDLVYPGMPSAERSATITDEGPLGDG
jgi:hypothetical protein